MRYSICFRIVLLLFFPPTSTTKFRFDSIFVMTSEIDFEKFLLVHNRIIKGKENAIDF